MKDSINNISVEEQLSNPKRFKSLSDAKLFEEFPHTKPLVIANLQGSILYANNSFVKSFSLREGENLSLLETEPELFALIQGFSKSKYSSFHFDVFIPSSGNPDDLFYYVEIERIFIGENEYFVLILSSLSERFSLEKKINNLHHALEYGNVPVIITDSEGKITYSTKSFEEILKLNIEDLYNKNLSNVLSHFIDQKDVEEFETKLKNCSTYEQVISDIDENGSVWYKELRVTPIEKEQGGETNFIVTASDITNYVLKNRIIKRSEEKQRSIINNISDLLIIIKNEKESLIFESGNDNFFNTFNIERLKSTGRKIESVFEPEFYEVILNAIISINELRKNSLTFKYRDNSIKRDYIGSVTFTDDHHEMQRIFIISLKDATEQQLTEERLRSAYERENKINQLKSSFLANMSHEIRTPLNAIVGYSELIEDDVKSGNNESALELFSYLKDGFSRLLILVDNILEVSLIESGETELEISDASVIQILNSVFEKMQNIANESGINLELMLPDFDLTIKADQVKLQKVLAALIDNAIKYNENGGKVEVSAKTLNQIVEICIEDTGRGIKEENLQRMLESFAQEDEGHKRQYEGAGLGLTIAYNLTRLMGGEFSVESEVDKGTKITLTFPVVQ